MVIIQTDYTGKFLVL